MDWKNIFRRIQSGVIAVDKKKLVTLLYASGVTLLIFLLLPVMYVFSRNQTGNLLNSRRSTQKWQTVKLHKQKQKKETMIKKKIIRRETKRDDPSRNRFKLDLSMAMGTGDGVGVQSGRQMILRANQVDTPPVQKRSFAPAYPEDARKEGVEASVSVDLLIETDGSVKEVLIKKCPPNWGFEQAVREALLRWVFSPAKNKDMPVKVWATITIDFKI